MEPRQTTKTIVRHLARGGSAMAVGNLVARNRNTSDNDAVDTYYKASSVVGGFVAGAIVGDYVGKAAEVKVDAAFDWINKTFHKTF